MNTYLVIAAAVVSLLMAFGLYRKNVSIKVEDARMREIAGYIQEGAMAYLKRQYIVMAVFAAVMTVVLQGDVIVAAHIDEYQVGAGMVGVPNSENGFGGFADGKVLYSKRVNAEAYSANMAKSGSTVALDVNYDLIQAFCVGKTVAEAVKNAAIKSGVARI